MYPRSRGIVCTAMMRHLLLLLVVISNIHALVRLQSKAQQSGRYRMVLPLSALQSSAQQYSRSSTGTSGGGGMSSVEDSEPAGHSFTYYRSLHDRCTRLQSLESEFLLSFWSPQLHCFNIQPSNDAAPRVSITSTCLAIHSMLLSPEHWKKVASWEPHESSVISLRQVVQSLQRTPWSGDAFQTPILVQTLCQLRAVDKDEPAFAAAVDTVLSQRSRLSLHRKQPSSAYLRFHNVRALLAVVESGMVPSAIVGTNQIGYALERANMVAYDELSRQLAFSLSDDSANFDVIVLAYSLLAYWESSQSLFLGSFARGVVPPTNVKLVKSALRVIFSKQSSDGTWRKGEPIFKTTGEYNGKRDIGNAYVFFFDLVGSLLGPLARAQPELLCPYLPNFERCISWAETNILSEMLPEKCDEVTRRCVGNVVRGWRSNHLDTGGAVAWCTAQVFSAVAGLQQLLGTFITSSVLEEFSGQRADSRGSLGLGLGPSSPSSSSSASSPPAALGSPQRWDALMDTDLELGGERTTLKRALLPRLLQPQLDKQAALARALTPQSASSALQTLTSCPPIYSLILFGPPGTAKTTICSAVASFLGWHFVTIDTACFLADGLEHVASRMSYIFDRLKALDRTIILFDEIEEFCLDRENPALGMESRLLTTAILTQLNALRARQSNIFIVATNRLRSFDAAVTRPGRFDLLLFVGTPNLDARVRRLTSKLENTSLSPERQREAAALFSSLLTARWEALRFLTFAENEALLNAALDLFIRAEAALPAIDASSTSTIDTLSTSDTGSTSSTTTSTAHDINSNINSESTNKDSSSSTTDSIRLQLSARADSILRTATIQGSVRDEYVASESLSRL